MKVIEGRRNNLQIISKQTSEDERFIQMVRNLLAHTDYASKAQIEQKIWEFLSESMTEKQKEDKISNLLKKMKKAQIIDTTGKGPYAKWYLVE